MNRSIHCYKSQNQENYRNYQQYHGFDFFVNLSYYSDIHHKY